MSDRMEPLTDPAKFCPSCEMKQVARGRCRNCGWRPAKPPLCPGSGQRSTIEPRMCIVCHFPSPGPIVPEHEPIIQAIAFCKQCYPVVVEGQAVVARLIGPNETCSACGWRQQQEN